MTTTEHGIRTPSGSRRSVSRRTLLVGTAWAVPAVVVATAAPAIAASPQSCSYTFDASGTCRVQTFTGAFTGYNIRLCATRDQSCATADATLSVTVTDNLGRSLSFPVAIARGQVTGCSGTVFFNSGSSFITTLSFTYTVNGSAPRTGSVSLPSVTCQ